MNFLLRVTTVALRANTDRKLKFLTGGGSIWSKISGRRISPINRNVVVSFFRFVTIHAFARRTDRRISDRQYRVAYNAARWQLDNLDFSLNFVWCSRNCNINLSIFCLICFSFMPSLVTSWKLELESCLLRMLYRFTWSAHRAARTWNVGCARRNSAITAVIPGMMSIFWAAWKSWTKTDNSRISVLMKKERT